MDLDQAAGGVRIVERPRLVHGRRDKVLVSGVRRHRGDLHMLDRGCFHQWTARHIHQDFKKAMLQKSYELIVLLAFSHCR